MIYYVVSGKLTEKIIKNILDLYVMHNKVDTKLRNKRICKTPFKKWYVKGYTNKSDFNKIVSYILGFIKDINDNLKVISKTITITKINYI